jgi:hypothetical protein
MKNIQVIDGARVRRGLAVAIGFAAVVGMSVLVSRFTGKNSHDGGHH